VLATGKAVKESFQEAFQKDYAGFEKELQTYIGRYTFPVVRYKLNNKIDFEREMQVSSLTDAQVQYYLGDLLLHIQRFDTAETFLQKAISLDSKFAPSYASMGMLKVRLDRNEEALKFLTQAVQTDSKNYMAHYYYAYMLQTVGEKDASSRDDSRYERMREHLKKCIELAPGYLPAYDMLGYVALNLHTELSETNTLLAKVLQSSPGRQEIRLRLAELMVANDEQQAARVIVLPLKESQDDFVRERARALVEHIERYMENRRALLEYEERRRKAEAAATVAVEAQPAVSDNATNEPADAPPAITRKPGTPAGGGGLIETAAPQIRRPSGQELEGVLLSADCSRGLTLRVGVGNGNVELHSPDPSKIEFVSYTTAVSDSFACGSFRSGPPVRVIYRRSSDPRYLGEPLRVEFIEKSKP
jgi:tetratricopeptide (TPR) repeat protein